MYDAKNNFTIGLGIKKNNYWFFESKTYKINGLTGYLIWFDLHQNDQEV